MASSSTHFDDECPKFFKVFLPKDCSNQLHICSDFKTHLQTAVKRKATIFRPGTNQEWKVGLEEEEEEFYFRMGWKEFVKENDLKVGEFMVFTYLGNSNFSVKLYGTHGCLKETVQEGEAPAEIELMYKRGKQTRRPGAGRPPSYDPDEELVRVAQAYRSAHSDIPSFMVKITTSYLTHNLVNIPVQWVNAHMEGGDVREIKLQGPPPRKTWTVKMTVYRPSSGSNCKLSKGLSAFFLDNYVQLGDICVFELVKNAPNTLKVTIFRKNDVLVFQS
ncbi:B3 domain-containing protein Os03g0212300-like [Chenopodium quinoa]|nr:B3 domain-containing protein Os03g0212300-like [Chenopodium quinoa]